MLEGIHWALSVCGSVCVRRSNCLWCGLMHGNSTFCLTPALNSLKWTNCVCWLDLLWFFCVCCLSVSKLLCVANQFVPLLWFILEHDTRVMAKERQKKDNHNLSKCLPLPFNSLTVYHLKMKLAFSTAADNALIMLFSCLLSWKKAKIQHQLQD